MTAATLSTKGQVTIPIQIRERLGLDTGDRLEFVELNDGSFAIRPALDDVQSLKGMLRKPKKAVTIEDMNRTIARRAAGAKRGAGR